MLDTLGIGIERNRIDARAGGFRSHNFLRTADKRPSKRRQIPPQISGRRILIHNYYWSLGVCRKTCSAASWLALRPRVALVRWSLTAGNGCLDLFTNWRDEPVPLWEGHYKISPIDTDDYLLSCCRYVERNPVKAGMVEAPEDYPGSSYAARIGLTHCDWLDGPPTMAELGSDASSRRERYRAFVGDGEFSHQDDLIRAAIDRNKLTGGNRFVDEVLEIQVEEALVRQN